MMEIHEHVRHRILRVWMDQNKAKANPRISTRLSVIRPLGGTLNPECDLFGLLFLKGEIS
jgi:hypothetical protein